MNLMPDVSALTEDVTLGAQSFQIIRAGGEWVEGKFVENPKTIKATGIIQPVGDQMLNQSENGDRTSGMIKIYTTTVMRIANQTSPHHVSDVVVWQGNRYRAQSLTPWIQYGFNVVTLTRE